MPKKLYSIDLPEVSALLKQLKHTPGIWIKAPHTFYAYAHDYRMRICQEFESTVRHPETTEGPAIVFGKSLEEVAANNRLVAAAPELIRDLITDLPILSGLLGNRFLSNQQNMEVQAAIKDKMELLNKIL